MQPLQAKLRWDIDVRPLHRETSTIRFVPTSERRRAIVTCLATMCASTGVTGYPRSASCPRRRAIALRWTTLVRWSGSPYPVLTLPPHVGRRCTYTMPHKAVEKPKVSKLPAPIAL